MSIFPFIDAPESTAVSSGNTVPREFAWDFENNELILQDGKAVIVEGLEAIRIWIYKALRTKRYRWLIYTWNYGHELDDLVGNSYSRAAVESEAKRYIEEALLINQYIKGIRNVSTTFDSEKLTVSFIAITDYGEVEGSV